jgi:cell division protein ZapD
MTLRLIRSSIGFKQETATDGYYQQSLDSHQSHQLIRVKLPASVNVYPEISGGKHRFTVRFMIFDINQRAQQSTETIPFQLSCCAM